MNNLFKRINNLRQRVFCTFYKQYRASIYRHKTLSPQLQETFKKLERDGACVTHLSELGEVDCCWFEKYRKDLINVLDAEDAKRGDKIGNKAYRVSLPNSEIEHFPLLYQFGLNPQLLSLIENYIKMPIFFRGINVLKDIADNNNCETRLWHRDGEDNRIIKFIVYLNDVDEETGPFCYIPKNVTKYKRINKNEERVSDEKMNRFVNKKFQIACTGKAGAMLIADTCSLFHRGLLPIKGPRYAIFFCYNSQYPLKPYYCSPLQQFDTHNINWCLTPQQVAATQLNYDC